jgi:hypothetical protein
VSGVAAPETRPQSVAPLTAVRAAHAGDALCAVDVVKAFGLESEQQMKDAIKQRLGVNVQIQQQSAMHSQISKYLGDSTKVDLPARVTAQQAARTLERRRLELMYRGIEPHKIEEHMAELRAASSAAAATNMPGVQMPHCAAPRARKACCSASPFVVLVGRPSMVTMLALHIMLLVMIRATNLMMTINTVKTD